MKLSEGGRRVTRFNLINNGFEVIGETFKDVLDLIFMLDWLAKESEFVKTSGKPLIVLIDEFGSLGPLLELLLQLFDMTAARFSVGRGQCCPYLGRSSCLGQQRLKGGGDCS